jgi:tRNA(fMet)-specific endonuclease VapC
MSRFLLDTNIVIHLLKHTDSPVASKLAQYNPDDVCVCSIVRAELFYGAAKSNQPEKSRAIQTAFLELFVSHPFDHDAADHYASIRASLERRGTPIGGNDLMIASIALARNLVLVTANVREFSRIESLAVENWIEPTHF